MDLRDLSAAASGTNGDSCANEPAFSDHRLTTGAAGQGVHQTGFVPRKQLIMHNPPHTYGDCQRTCLAMALGLAPEDVPHFGDANLFPIDQSRAAERAWLASRGIGYVQVPLYGGWGWDWVKGLLDQQAGTPVIISGKSPRGAWNHDVVYFDGEIHDPHPDGSGLEGPCINEDQPDEPQWYWVNVLAPLPSLLSAPAAPPAADLVEKLRADLRAERLKPCRHTKAKAEPDKAIRPDLNAWQTAQSEWFDDTILEIVGEYAAWRDAQQNVTPAAPTAADLVERVAKAIDRAEVPCTIRLTRLVDDESTYTAIIGDELREFGSYEEASEWLTGFRQAAKARAAIAAMPTQPGGILLPGCIPEEE